MKVLLAEANSGGADYYRVQEPARAVREAGLDVEVLLRHGIATTMKPPPGGGNLEVVSADAEGADVVVLQLPKTKEMLAIIRLLQAQGVGVVVEMDDSMSAVPYGHMGYTAIIREAWATGRGSARSRRTW